MATFVIDSATLPMPLSKVFHTSLVAAVRQRGGDYLLSPIVDSANYDDASSDIDDIDPDDYDNDTDYLYAIPGLVDKVLKARNAPLSKSKPVPEEWFNV